MCCVIYTYGRLFTPLKDLYLLEYWSINLPDFVSVFTQRLFRPLKTCTLPLTVPLLPPPLEAFVAMTFSY